MRSTTGWKTPCSFINVNLNIKKIEAGYEKAILFAAALFVAVASFAQNEYNYQKRSLFEQLPIRGNDIVFLGNSITDGCEWAELFNNRHIKNRGISADRSGWLLDRLDPIVNGHPKNCS